MTTDGESESLTTALHDAAYSFEPPPHAYFRDRAVQRTRQIKRRRIVVGSTLTCLLTLGVGTLSITLTDHTPSDATAAGISTTASVRTMPPASAAASPGASPAVGGGVTQQQVLQALLSALPASADALKTQNPEQGIAAPWATGPQVNSQTGNWYVAGGASLKSSSATGASIVSISAQHGLQTKTCVEAEAGSTVDTCSVSHVDGGTLILDETPHHPDRIWEYFWQSPAGNEVDLSIGDDTVADFALTKQQVIDVLTDPVWGRIAAELPAPVCPGGKLTQVMPTVAPTSTPQINLTCSTDGKTYPMG
ncbi:hypothetical protein KDL01_29545 [Actinospica durhamensis]|uniref:Uncharacterized protein n=1 Tax=Actinospica durhamensis TaxID=1508375 RepID=A0A941ETR1_9ACTN|nr:hypothetical protein [Actinospica durhamensis]MBR7837460.1 hypothetical protein [Actinospica durhamensis]